MRILIKILAIRVVWLGPSCPLVIIDTVTVGLELMGSGSVGSNS